MDEAIYRRPRDYDLEHDDDGEDVAFYVELAKRLRPRRVLEQGAGSGRVTTPLAELGARAGFTITALDASPEMLAEAKRKLAAAEPRVRERVELVTGEIDSDTTDDEGRRLVRYRTTDYAPLEQRASIRFLYDKFARERAERWVSDFESHVYFPRELELLYRQTGFVVEATYGDYRVRPPRGSPRALVLVGRKHPAGGADDATKRSTKRRPIRCS